MMIFFMDMPYTGHVDGDGNEKKIKSHVKRYDVKLSILRECFVFISDPRYIVLKSKYKSKSNKILLPEHYYTNRLTYDGKPIYTSLHPKTIVYMVQYYSHIANKYRYTAIVGKDINTNVPSGYSYKASGIWHFMNQHKKQFLKKKAYIYPIFWYMVELLYSDVKIVTVTA